MNKGTSGHWGREKTVFFLQWPSHTLGNPAVDAQFCEEAFRHRVTDSV
jgi:hypothetical protein